MPKSLDSNDKAEDEEKCRENGGHDTESDMGCGPIGKSAHTKESQHGNGSKHRAWHSLAPS